MILYYGYMSYMYYGYMSLYICLTHRTYSTKSELYYKLWSLGNYHVLTQFTDCNQCTTLVGNINGGQTVHFGGREYNGNLYTSISFAMNLKLFLIRVLIKTLKYLSCISQSIVNYNCHVVCYTPSTYLIYNWKSVSLDHLHPIPLPSSTTSGNHKSNLCFCEFVYFDFTNK